MLKNDLLLWMLILGLIIALCGVAFLIAALFGRFRDTKSDAGLDMRWLKLTRNMLIIFGIIAVGVLLMSPKLYFEVFSPQVDLKSLHSGYDLCVERPYSTPFNISGGPDDQTRVVLQSLTDLPSSPEDMAQWGLGIAKLLKNDREVLESLQSSIVRSNFLAEIVGDYCRALAKPENERTGSESNAFERINSAMGISP